jgi:hypothetical protein
MPPKRGRPPTPVDKKISDEICKWVAEGNTLRDWCRIPGNPTWVTVYDWIIKDPVFALRYKESRDLGMDAIAEDTMQIIDEEPRLVVDAQGVARYDSTHAAWAKNRVELRLKLLAKWNPKKYGEKVEHSGTVAFGTVDALKALNEESS